ncbi:MAG: DUF433 domain-containing protein [Acidobacteriota bacterium]
MSTIFTDSLIVETPRGPSIAGTRITIYAVMDYLKGNWSRNFTRQMLDITDEQFDAALEYIAQHKEDAERDYAEILRRAEELRARYEDQNSTRSPFPPGSSLEEQRQMMLQKLEQMRNGTDNGYGHPAGQ